MYCDDGGNITRIYIPSEKMLLMQMKMLNLAGVYNDRLIIEVKEMSMWMKGVVWFSSDNENMDWFFTSARKLSTKPKFQLKLSAYELVRSCNFDECTAHKSLCGVSEYDYNKIKFKANTVAKRVYGLEVSSYEELTRYNKCSILYVNLLLVLRGCGVVC
jgi:hypothetical protein